MKLMYLNRGLKKPMIILISVICVPLICMAFWAFLTTFKASVLVSLIIIIIVYMVALWRIDVYSKSDKFFLEVNDDGIVIKYQNVSKFLEHKTISYQDIIQFEYYKLFSFRSLILLHSCILPQGVFLTILNGGSEESLFIGYPDLCELESLCKDRKLILLKK